MYRLKIATYKTIIRKPVVSDWYKTRYFFGDESLRLNVLWTKLQGI